MDYFQGVVTEFLRANRATFVNTECLIQLEPGDVPAKGRHWYCDVVAINFAERSVHLCEVTFSTTLHALFTRLAGWKSAWLGVKRALVRDCRIPEDWSVRPHVFIPSGRVAVYERKLAMLERVPSVEGMPIPLVTHLEEVVPWKYRSWDRKLAGLADEAQSSKSDDAPDNDSAVGLRLT